MIKPGDGRAASVITLRTPAVIIQERLSEIRASFPGWHVWHDTWWSGTWNAHREDWKPYFGPVPDGAPVFMVCAHRAAALVALLERQTLIDMEPSSRAGGSGERDRAAGTRSPAARTASGPFRTWPLPRCETPCGR